MSLCQSSQHAVSRKSILISPPVVKNLGLPKDDPPDSMMWGGLVTSQLHTPYLGSTPGPTMWGGLMTSWPHTPYQGSTPCSTMWGGLVTPWPHTPQQFRDLKYRQFPVLSITILRCQCDEFQNKGWKNCSHPPCKAQEDYHCSHNYKHSIHLRARCSSAIVIVKWMLSDATYKHHCYISPIHREGSPSIDAASWSGQVTWDQIY